MRPLKFCLALLTCAAFVACDLQNFHTVAPPEDAPVPSSPGGNIPKVKSINEGDKSYTYKYDAQGRILEERYASGSVGLYSYTPGEVKIQWFNEVGVPGVEFHEILDSEGRCIQQTESDDTRTDIYEYDADGYLTKETSLNPDGSIFNEWYHFYENGNAVKDSMSRTSDGASYVYVNTYYTEIKNTTGDKNIGIQFWGKQNTNALKSKFFTTNAGQVIRYDYEEPVLDDKDRIISRSVNISGGSHNTWVYTYY